MQGTGRTCAVRVGRADDAHLLPSDLADADYLDEVLPVPVAEAPEAAAKLRAVAC
jgi:hypothetical protein